MLVPDPNPDPKPESGTVMHSAKAKKLQFLRLRFLNTAFNAQRPLHLIEVLLRKIT
jgi:hypothetical protein